MFVLQLNEMHGKAEYLEPVAVAETREALLDFMAREKVDPYTDTDQSSMYFAGDYKWGKRFRKGGPLEWYNPPFDMNAAIVDIGDELIAAQNAVEHFNRFVSRLIKV